MKGSFFDLLKKKITAHDAKVTIIGLGYVGLPYALEFAKNNFHVIGIDLNEKRVNALKNNESYITDIGSEELKDINETGFISYTSSYDNIDNTDVIDICVPTPLGKSKEPDMYFITSAVKEIKSHISKPKLIILTSTTYPGTTREYVVETIKDKNYVLDKDFFAVFSPERIDPGNKRYKLPDITKVVGGVTQFSTELAQLLFKQIIRNVVTVSSADTAEMVKLLENTFRSVNIGLINEMAIISNKLGINIWEVIDAAKTKPYGFVPFYPGPGIGGHCIPIDPVYLTWKMKVFNYRTRFIELATDINNDMPLYIVNRLAELLNKKGKSIKNSKVLILGVAYKRDVSDLRESPSIPVIEEIRHRYGKIMYCDPYVDRIEENGLSMKSTKLNKKILSDADCVIILTDHSVYNYDWIVKYAKLVFDTKNATKSIKSDKVIKL
ncbi:MAG: nucleotide sugar dehydrogenase [Deltaproteobacteria bacterium]|nr:nucleotide sugar dehydrogenase [Deltaproteobacteria bacterium]MCL5792012.1 nucleotide sugar dehydrogenase [Deltaproteobacteria bacterium]